MKKILFLILFSSGFFCSPAQTSVYHPFPDSNAYWNIMGIQPWGCPFSQDYYEWFSITISGDTTIGNNVYRKLEIPFIQKTCTQGGLHFPGYAGAFRQDTAARKVFFVHQNDSIEQLLYDFTMVVGDTVRGYHVDPWMCGPNDDIVTSIDSIMIGSTYRKRWNIGWYFSFIEGVGSTTGLLDPICEIIDGPMISLTCFNQDDSILYPYNSTTCDLITSIRNENSETENSITISPNPFHSFGKLEMGNRKFGNENFIIRIFNTMGVLIREEKILNLTSYILHRDGLHDGLYFYELQSPNSELIGTGKFVIQ